MVACTFNPSTCKAEPALHSRARVYNSKNQTKNLVSEQKEKLVRAVTLHKDED